MNNMVNPYNHPGMWNPYHQGSYGNNTQSQTTDTSSIVWVQGEAGAKAYPVQPGCSVVLMDSENPYFYIKMADASGMPLPLRVFEYSERKAPEPAAMITMNPDEYVTKDYFDKKIGEITARLSSMNRREGEYNG